LEQDRSTKKTFEIFAATAQVGHAGLLGKLQHSSNFQFQVAFRAASSSLPEPDVFAQLICSAVISFVLALTFTPAVRACALRLRIVDAPDGFRKLHARQVPLAGGLAVALACGFTAVIGAMAGIAWTRNISFEPEISLGIASGAMIITAVGLLDDRYQIRGRQKLLGQIAAGLLAVAGGLVIDRVAFFGVSIQLGLLAVPLTLCWLVGAMNALNLIDGVDGLATSVGIVICGTLCVISTMGQQYGDAAATATLAGALLGFLPFNWRPAKIFLGDTGSMFIGYMLGVLAIRGNLKGPATVALIAPAAIWAIPLFDVMIAILRRKLTGQSVYVTDRGHLHHVLQRYGLGHVGTVLVIAGLCLVCSLGVIFSLYLKNELAAIVTVFAVLSALVLTRSFGHTECHLLARKIFGFVRSFVRIPNAPHSGNQLCSRFHGSREFEQAWETLVGFAERFQLSSLNFNVNAPMIGEVFHAHWQDRDDGPSRMRWLSELPLVWKTHEIGRLTIQGMVPADQSPFAWSSDLMSGLRPFETIVLHLLDDDLAPAEPLSKPVATVRPVHRSLIDARGPGEIEHSRPVEALTQ
jgi:UDP-GlcNAc:undecaprenyl-phosphate GlcNAc-1-phosphate transferase